MESRKIVMLKAVIFVAVLSLIGGAAFAAGLAWSMSAAQAAGLVPGAKVMQAEGGSNGAGGASNGGSGPRVVYPEKTELDFEGTQIEGEVRNPGEFYFQRRPQEKFDSLVKPRKEFHQQMLRDVVLSK